MLVFAWRKFLQFEGRRLYPDKARISAVHGTADEGMGLVNGLSTA